MYRYHIGTLDIGFSIDRCRVDDKWNVRNFSMFIILFRLLTLIYTQKIIQVKLSILCWRVIRCYISTSPERKLRNNGDVIDYFAGDNEIYE